MLLMLFPLSLSRQAADDIKTAGREQFPHVKSSHLTEAIAAGFGYQTNAAMRAALDANRAPGHFAIVRFGKRLVELGYDTPADFLAAGSSMSWNAQCLYSLMVAAVCQSDADAVAKGARLPIAQSMNRMKESGCRKENSPMRKSIPPNPAWLSRGPHGKQFAHFIDLYGDAIEDINTAAFQVSDGSRTVHWTLLRSLSFVEPYSEGLSFTLSDTAARFARRALSGPINYSRGNAIENEINIALDAYTLEKFGVDQKAYQSRLNAALPDHRLTFSIAPDSPMAVGFRYAINMVSGPNDAPRLVTEAAEKVWPMVIGPSIEAIKALDGKIFAMLTADQREVLDYYRDRGRKYGVTVEILNEGDPDELARANSRLQADQILAKTNSRVRVVVA